jgi:polyisoprenoid-binding protein YceI
MKLNVSAATLAALIWCALAVRVESAALQMDYQQSRIEVAVNSTVDSFVGHLDGFTATVDCEPTASLPGKATVEFDFSNLKTGNTNRDTEMLKWLQYSSNPKASFVLNGWERSGTTNLALGELTIHQITQVIQIPVTVENTNGVWTISGESRIDYRDFKLPKIRKMVVLVVDPHLKVAFHLVGKLPGSQ